MPAHDPDPDPDPNGNDPELDAAHVDAAWEDILANYGERPSLTDPDDHGVTGVTGVTGDTVNPRAQHPDPDPRVYELRSHQAEEADREATPQWWEREEHFTPPEPPPAPLPRGPRGLAWAGVFGLPVIAIVCVLVRYAVPEWVGTLALLAFLASMGYLFWTMPRNDDDDDPFGGNNGAVV